MLAVLDLFSGIGGFSLGLERTGGFKTVAFCEIDPFCRQVLAKHWPDVPIHEDVTKLRGEDVGPVDVIAGGFPCQDVSEVGSRIGLAGSRSGLWTEFARLIGELRPSYVIVENVTGLLTRGMGDVLGDLASIRYNAEWSVLPFCALGAPHSRARVFLLAYPDEQRLQTGRSAGDGYDAPQARRRIDPQYLHSSALTIGCEVRATFAGEPNVGRVAHGVPARVDRLRSLGNAVVPQVVEVIGNAILEAA